MKKFKFLLFVLLSINLITSCSDSNDLLDEEAIIEKSSSINFTSLDSLAVEANANLDMVSFVNDISEFYERGDTYADLKIKLDPVNHLNSMNIVADDLLFAAFNHLSNDGRNQDLTGIEMLTFFDTMLKNAQLDSVQYISEVDFEQRSIDLWGSDIEDLSKGSCKWYQVGCHLSNFWNWLNDKPGDGGQSNLQMIGTVLGIVALIIGLLNE